MRKEFGSVDVYSPNIPAENVTAEDRARLQKLEDTAQKVSEGRVRMLDDHGTVFLVARETGNPRFGSKKQYEIDTVIKGGTALIIEENTMSGKYKNEVQALTAAEEQSRAKFSEKKGKGFIESQLPVLHELATRDKKARDRKAK